MFDLLAGIAWQCWLVLGDMAPYLLLGFFLAGLLSVWISPEWIGRHLGARGIGPVWKAALLGVPLPLCSCGVIPVAAGMRRHGASRAATIAFLLSTPQTGVDSIAVTYALLGPVFAVFRPVAALVSGVLGGVLVLLFGQRNGAAEPDPPPECNESCCAPGPRRSALWRALVYGFVTLPRDLAVSLLIGVVLAGVVGAVVKPNQFAGALGTGIVPILLMMAAGIPLYVCATASVPIAAGLMHMGASPGAALAFLIAGPATNAATITTTWKVLGKRTAVLYLLTVALSAVLCGLLLDHLVSWVQWAMPHLDAHAHEHVHVGLLTHVWAVLLLVVLGWSYLAPRLSGALSVFAGKGDVHLPERPGCSELIPECGTAAPGCAELSMTAEGGCPTKPVTFSQREPAAAVAPQRIELRIAGMTCGHCAETVRGALAACRGVGGVEVDRAAGRAVVTGAGLDPAALSAAVAAAGFSVTEVSG